MKNFKKIVITFIGSFLVLIPSILLADTVKVSNEKDLIDAIEKNNTVILSNDIEVKNTIVVNENLNVTIDLNGKTLTLGGKAIDIYGKLNIIGSGIISGDCPGSSSIWLNALDDKTASEKVVLSVGKDVTINTSGYAIGIWYATKSSGYGTVVNFNGTINARGEKANGITINGYIQNEGSIVNAPIFNFGETAVIKSDNFVFYAAGIGTWNIKGGYYEGSDVLGIKSGKIKVENATFKATGEAKTGTYNGNGINSTGSALQIESNNGYAGNISISIKDSKFESVNGNAFYHYFAPKNNGEIVKNSLLDLTIDGVDFKGGIEFVEKDNITIESGKFTSSIFKYLKNGYIEKKEDETYSVINIIGTGNGLLINGKPNIEYIKPGSEVTISTMGMYELEGLDVTTADDEKVTVKDGKFIMPNKLVRVNAKTIKLYEILYDSNANAEVTFTVDGKANDIAKAGAKVKFSYTVKDGYVVKSISLINTDTDEEVEVKDNAFTMPEGSVELKIITETKGIIKEVTKPIEVSKDIDKDVVEDLSKVKVDNSNTGLVEAVDTSKLDGITETDKVEMSISTKLESYDKEKNTLVFEIKPIYSVNGVTKGIIPNSALSKTIKIELPVPSDVTDTHVKVIHKSGDKILDTKSYEIKTRDGKKYITIETESFSTFELSFYTPSNTENPKTGDSIMLYASAFLISLLGISAIVVVKKHF